MDTLISILWDPEQRIQLCYAWILDLQELRDLKCVLRRKVGGNLLQSEKKKKKPPRIQHYISSYRFDFVFPKDKPPTQTTCKTLLTGSHLSKLPELHFEGKRQRRQSNQKLTWDIFSVITLENSWQPGPWLFIGTVPSPCWPGPGSPVLGD